MLKQIYETGCKQNRARKRARTLLAGRTTHAPEQPSGARYTLRHVQPVAARTTSDLPCRPDLIFGRSWSLYVVGPGCPLRLLLPRGPIELEPSERWKPDPLLAGWKVVLLSGARCASTCGLCGLYVLCASVKGNA